MLLIHLFILSTYCWRLFMAEIDCPDDFVQIDSKYCFYDTKKVASFCEANRICADIGKNIGKHVILVGGNYVKASKLNFNAEFMWTSLNNFYIAKGYPKTSWRDADPQGLIYTKENLTKIENELEKVQNVEPTLVYDRTSGKLRDYPTEFSKYVVCELVQDFPSNVTSTENIGNFHFNKEQLPISISNVSQTSKLDGCYEPLVVESEKHCAELCIQNEYCRMIHYSDEQGDCVIINYVFSMIPSFYSDEPKTWSTHERLYKIQRYSPQCG